VILKPSEVTPLTSLKLLEGMQECGVPDGVFQIATGTGQTGAALVREVDMIMFTGSTKTGKLVMKEAAEALIPVSLELGGKDATIVCADADIERAANTVVYYSMFNCGQTCISVERVYVEEPVYDRFVKLVEEKARALRNGYGAAGSADVGSMTFPPQVDIVERHIDDAKSKGARVVVGGKRINEGHGYWFEPTVLVDVNHDMTCMNEETFGPTLPIMKVADTEEAIRLANDSPYGLAASVFSKDTKKADEIGRRLDVGAVCINDALINYSALELPMGGVKQSGIGSRHGRGGIRKYCQQQSVLITRLAGKKDPHMYPYTAGRTKLLSRLFGFLYGRGKRP
jgi:acyl-CoA reductase-like NAD-dependent aldehyde dehydrogenase